MNLATFVSIPSIREKFRNEFPLPNFNVEKKMLAPPLSENYALVGTAFDYFLRFYIERLNKFTITREWVAEVAIQALESGLVEHTSGKDYKTARKIVSEANDLYEKYIKSGEITVNLLKSTLLLSQLDRIYREKIVPKNLGVVDEKDIWDLANLSSYLKPETFTAERHCFLNPTFGKGSRIVGGADSDLIIDGNLIEIKTTKYLNLSEGFYHQLIGYYILSRIGMINGIVPSYEIDKIGVYYSRHAYLHLFDIDQIIDENSLPDLIKWFTKEANKLRDR